MGNGVEHANKITRRRARLVLRWVTLGGHIQWRSCGFGRPDAEAMKSASLHPHESRHVGLTPALLFSVTPLTVGSFSKLYQTHFCGR